MSRKIKIAVFSLIALAGIGYFAWPKVKEMMPPPTLAPGPDRPDIVPMSEAEVQAMVKESEKVKVGSALNN